MADAPEIKVKLTAEDQGVAAAIKELGAQLKNLKQQQDDTAGSSNNLANAFKGLIAVIAVEKLLAFGKATLDAAASIARASEVTGASVQTLTVFHKAAEDIGVSTEAVDKGFVKLSRSMLQFQQGNTQATAAFKALGVSAKDLAGLNTDQKILLITNRLGSMKDGMTKAALAQQLLGRGGAELIPVLNDLAGDGFENARAKAEQFGLLLDNDTQAAMLAAKKSFQDLEDTGKGMATQFEAGIVPAITDISNALVKATTEEGVSGFRQFGTFVGGILKGLVLDVALLVGAILEAGAKTSALVQNIGRAIGDTFTKGIKTAITNFQSNELGDAARIEAEIQSRTASLYSELQGNTREQDTTAAKARAAKRQQSQEPTIGPATTSDAAAKAQLALTQKQLQDEIQLFQAYFAKRAEQDKSEYDRGEISLQQYFDRRRADVQAAAQEEITILKQERDAAQAAANKAGSDAKAAPNAKEADKSTAEKLTLLAKVDELNTKIALEQSAASTKQGELDAEQFAKTQANDRNIAEIEKQLATTQKDRVKAAEEEVAVKTREYQLALEQRGTDSPTQINAKVAALREAITAQAEFDQAQKKTEEDQKAFELAKQQIEIQAKAGRKSPLETEREINQLLQERLPLLQADAAAEAGAAQKTGNTDNIAAAQNAQQGVENLKASATSLGAQLGGPIAGDFTSFFENIGKGTRSVADQFRGLAASVVASIEQMLIKLLLLKIAQQAAGAFSPGSFGASFFGAFGKAEGGLIRGPGGPKGDKIPARLSDGEYVVKADAVRNFGVHNLEAINRGLKVPSIEHLALPKFAEGGLVGTGGEGPGDSNIHLGIGLDEGLILKHLSSKAAGRVILQQLTNNPKAASKALSRSQ